VPYREGVSFAHGRAPRGAQHQPRPGSGYPFLPAIEIGNSVITEYSGEPQLIEVLVAEKYL
jgi:hypothetical protein